MFSIRPLVLIGICRTKCPRLAKIGGSVPQLRNVLCENQLPNEYGRRSFCRRTTNDQNFAEDEDVDEELRGYQEEDTAPPIDEKKQRKEEIFEEISKGDAAILKSLKLLDLEIAFLRSQKWRVPDYVNKENWEELLRKKSLSQRKKHLAFLRLNELKEYSAREKAKVRQERALKQKQEAGFHYYGMSGHSMFMRIYERSLTRLLDLKHQIHPGLKVVLDCSYEEYMSEINVKACAKQMALCMYNARYHRQPCQISVCNFQEDSHLARLLPRFAPKFFEVLGPNIHKENMSEVFPRERLVYLTPDAVNDLVFNPEDVFIIGAFVDKGVGTKVSAAKARTSDLRQARLPIDSYVYWKQGTKSLSLNTVLKILLDMGFYNDWSKALTNLPKRCIKDAPQMPLLNKSHQRL